MNFLTKQKFFDRVNTLRSRNLAYDHWKDSRWNYHSIASALAQYINPKRVLELGTMGVKICEFSDEMDFPIADFWPVDSPKYLHNAKETPWPVETGAYDLFIALRVFHHLNPFQKECFLEAKRIAKWVLITIPVNYSHTAANRVITLDEMILINDGVPPVVVSETEEEFLYLWSGDLT